MPIYDYVCDFCGEQRTAQVPYGQRMEPQPCDNCHKGQGQYQMPTPRIGTERKRGDNRIIHHEAELGQHWRDEGTTGKPGGAGRVLTFDQGRR